jgi:hypothetical protein
MDESELKVYSLAAGADGGVPLDSFTRDYLNIHGSQLDFLEYGSLEELLIGAYSSVVKIEERRGIRYCVAVAKPELNYLMPETNRHEPGGSDKFASTGPPWTILFKTLNGKVLEREMEKHMMAYESYQGIHQPKNERQPDFHGNYSTFFVRFSNLQDARDAKVNFHHSKREYTFNGQLYKIETISSYAEPNSKEIEIREKIKRGEMPAEAYYKDQTRERDTYIEKGIIPPAMRNRQIFQSQPHPQSFNPQHPPPPLPPNVIYRPPYPPTFRPSNKIVLHNSPGQFHPNSNIRGFQKSSSSNNFRPHPQSYPTAAAHFSSQRGGMSHGRMSHNNINRYNNELTMEQGMLRHPSNNLCRGIGRKSTNQRQGLIRSSTCTSEKWKNSTNSSIELEIETGIKGKSYSLRVHVLRVTLVFIYFSLKIDYFGAFHVLTSLFPLLRLF